MHERSVNRRDLFAGAALGAAGALGGAGVWGASNVRSGAEGATAADGATGEAGPYTATRQLETVKVVSDMPYRRFGRTDELVSLLGIGGWHVGAARDDEEATRIIRTAIDGGVNFLDNAWCYHNGRSEERMGRALRDGYRAQAFLMTKHHGRERKAAMEHLEASLRRLKTDHLDLWQFHEIGWRRDADMIFGDDGSIDVATKAKEQGKVRYVGFTGHRNPQLLLQMLAFDYPWDAIMMPLNPFDPSYESFEEWVLPTCVQRGVAVIAMKTRGGGTLVREGGVSAELLWRYAAALPVSTITSGIDTAASMQAALRFAKLDPLSLDEMKSLREQVHPLASDGKLEVYKTTRRWDAPSGKAIHGFEG